MKEKKYVDVLYLIPENLYNSCCHGQVNLRVCSHIAIFTLQMYCLFVHYLLSFGLGLDNFIVDLNSNRTDHFLPCCGTATFE